jgi:Uma2 family endonuclease
MGMPTQHVVTTIEDLLALPYDGMRHELLDGEHVVTPAPSLTHQVVLLRLLDALRNAVAAFEGVEVLLSPADIHLGPRTLVQPDLFIVDLARVGLRAPWQAVPPPLLAAEVRSPSTAGDGGRSARVVPELRRERGRERRGAVHRARRVGLGDIRFQRRLCITPSSSSAAVP